MEFLEKLPVYLETSIITKPIMCSSLHSDCNAIKPQKKKSLKLFLIPTPKKNLGPGKKAQL